MIASGINIDGYAGLLLGRHTILHGITDNSLKVDTSITGYAGFLLSGHMILHDITNNYLRVDTSFVGYAELLLGGHKILHGIADCFRNQYHQVHRVVTARWAYGFI